MSIGGFPDESKFADLEAHIIQLGEEAKKVANTSELLKITLKLVKVALNCLQLARQMWREARHDAQTGLLNLRGVTEVYERMMSEMIHPSARVAQISAVVVFSFDVVRFKFYNETASWIEGTRLLREIGRLLRGSVRDVDAVARIGGDEFVVIVRVMDGKPEAVREEVNERLRGVLDDYNQEHEKDLKGFKVALRWRSSIVTPGVHWTFPDVLKQTEVKAKS